MKKIFLLIMCVAALTSCGKSSKKTQSESNTPVEVAGSSYLDVDSLLNVAENFVNQPVKVKGFVTHTCKHSGRRCFIAGESQKVTLRVEAKGDIGGFNRELVGSEILVDGILREYRMDEDQINDRENKLEEKIALEGETEQCSSEANNITAMRNWMKARGVNYYSIFYVDGESYEIAD